MRASWGTHETSINSRDDLERVVGDIRASAQPTMVFLEAENGNVFVFGVGREESVLTFIEPDGRTYHSLGSDPYRKGQLRFLSGDQIDDFMAEMAIPERDAIQAAAAFVVTRSRPEGVKWEADWEEDS